MQVSKFTVSSCVLRLSSNVTHFFDCKIVLQAKIVDIKCRHLIGVIRWKSKEKELWKVFARGRLWRRFENKGQVCGKFEGNKGLFVNDVL